MAEYTKLNRNFLSGYLLNNKALTVGLRDKTGLGELENFNTLDPMLKNRILNLTFSDLLQNNRLKTRAQILNVFQLRISDDDWNKIKKIFSAAFTRYGGNTGLSKNYNFFWDSTKKGSKRARKILENHNEITLPHNIVKFSSNTEVIIGQEDSAFINSFWFSHFLSSSMSIFCFKLINNILGFNYIVSHFIPDVERSCTFCNVAGLQDEEDETPLHLFFSCIVSERVLDTFFNRFLGVGISRQEFFAVPARENTSSNFTIFLTGMLVKKFLWDCKMRSTLPDSDLMERIILMELKTMATVSRKVNNFIQESELLPEIKNILRRG
jgi:hypothetical protein